jgi:hypothetical protein
MAHRPIYRVRVVESEPKNEAAILAVSFFVLEAFALRADNAFDDFGGAVDLVGCCAVA